MKRFKKLGLSLEKSMLLAGDDQVSWFFWTSPGLHLLSQCPIQIAYTFTLKSDPVWNINYMSPYYK